MRITSSDNRLIKLFSESYYLFIYILDIIFTVYIFISLGVDHKAVVCDRLNLKIVIEINKSCDLFGRSSFYNRAIKFARTAGTSDDKTLPVLYKFALWHKRKSSEIVYMRLTYKCIKINPSKRILRKDNTMIRAKVPDHLLCGLSEYVYIRKCLCLLFF